MTGSQIRPATAADLDSLAALMDELRRTMAAMNPAVEVLEDAHLRRLASNYLTGPFHLVLLALDGGVAAGFVRVNVRVGDGMAPMPGRKLPLRESLRRKLRGLRGQKPAASALYVADLFVRPACRRRGLGAALLAAAREAAAPLAPRYSYLLVLADNPEGRAFWERAGFRAESVTMVRR